MEFDPVDYPGRGAPIYGPLPPRRDLWTYGDLAKFVLFSLVAQIAFGILAMIATPLLFMAAERYLGVHHNVRTIKDCAIVAVTVLSAIASVGYVYYVVAVKYRLPFREALGFTAFRRPMYWFLLVGAVMSFAEGFLTGLIGVPEDTPFAEMLNTPVVYLSMGVFAVFVAPPLEEMLFRGFLYRPLERNWGPIGAVGVTGFIFGLMHGPQYAWSWQILLLLTLEGFLLGAARWRTGSIWPPILMHAASNLVAVVAFGVVNFFS